MEISKEKKQQDFVTNKLLIVFTMVFVGIFAAMYLYRMSNATAEGYLTAVNIINGLFYASAAATLATGAKWYMNSKKLVENPYKLITSKHLCCVFIAMFICFALAKVYSILFAVKYIYMLLTAIAVQYFVLVTYTKDIYLMAITNIVNLFLLYAMGTSVKKALFCALVSIVFLAGAFLIVKKAKSQGGMIKEYLVFKKNTNYKMLMANMSILAGITVLSVILSFMGYSIGVIIGGVYLIVVIFYNTLKIL